MLLCEKVEIGKRYLNRLRFSVFFCRYTSVVYRKRKKEYIITWLVFNATFSNISAISWR